MANTTVLVEEEDGGNVSSSDTAPKTIEELTQQASAIMNDSEICK